MGPADIVAATLAAAMYDKLIPAEGKHTLDDAEADKIAERHITILVGLYQRVLESLPDNGEGE